MCYRDFEFLDWLSGGLAGMFGTVTLPTRARLGTETAGLSGRNAAKDDNDGLLGLAVVALSPSHVVGAIQRIATMAVNDAAAGAHIRDRTVVSATSARIRVCRCCGAVMFW